MDWYWKWKPTWKKDMITYNSYPWIMFSFKWLVIIWRGLGEGGFFEIGRPRSKGWINFGRRWRREWEVLEMGQFSWTSYKLNSMNKFLTRKLQPICCAAYLSLLFLLFEFNWNQIQLAILLYGLFLFLCFFLAHLDYCILNTICSYVLLFYF